MISPAKLQNAAAVIDCIGMESKVIRATVVIALLMMLAAALMTFVFLGADLGERTGAGWRALSGAPASKKSNTGR